MRRISSFSIILVFAVLSILGAMSTPFLNLQYIPNEKSSTMRVTYSWPGTSARMVETCVTSVIEGAASSLSGVGDVKSVSKRGAGSVTIEVKDKEDLESARLYLSSKIRQIYDKLPEGVSYPDISISSDGLNNGPIMIFAMYPEVGNQQISCNHISSIVENVTSVPGVNSVQLSGESQKHIEITTDIEKMNRLGLTQIQVVSAIGNALPTSHFIGRVDGQNLVVEGTVEINDLNSVYIATVNGMRLQLSDLANVRLVESSPFPFLRVNGKPTISISVFPNSGINTIDVCKKVKGGIENIMSEWPDHMDLITLYDESEQLSEELNKILKRTILSMALLLLFVLLSGFGRQIALTIIISVISDLLISLLLYAILGIRLHMYSLAGLTVSIGIMLDASIVMATHYRWRGDITILKALACAQLTTIITISALFFVPFRQQYAYSDFAGVVIVHLIVSLLSAAFLVPAILNSLSNSDCVQCYKRRGVGRLLCWSHGYSRYIAKAGSFAWVIFAFVCLALVGSAYLFSKNSFADMSHYAPDKNLYVQARLPDGSTADQLEYIVKQMEMFISKFEGIDSFTTRAEDETSASIMISFKPQVQKSAFPSELKLALIDKAKECGGANWRVYGINNNDFNNIIASDGTKSERILVTGYDYEELYKYCQQSMNRLSENPRVNHAGIYGMTGSGKIVTRDNHLLSVDREHLAIEGLSIEEVFGPISDRLMHHTISQAVVDGEMVPVEISPSKSNRFDLWALNNRNIETGSRTILFSDFGRFVTEKTGHDIHKMNGQYCITVAYDYEGNYKSASRVIDREIAFLNNGNLPVGYKASKLTYSDEGETLQYLWVLLVALVAIYCILAVIFESLLLPLVVLSVIPLSMTGLLLTFALTGCHFDQGGFAAMLLSCGLVVNAAIYIINDYIESGRETIDSFVAAFNRKIRPSLLTILSTGLGLLPFLMDGPDEPFWFPFALGTIASMAFSIMPLVMMLPLYLPVKGVRT